MEMENSCGPVYGVRLWGPKEAMEHEKTEYGT